jgi:hypothetical protein
VEFRKQRTGFVIEAASPIRMQEGETVSERAHGATPRGPLHDFDEGRVARTLKSVATGEYLEFVICAKSG